MAGQGVFYLTILEGNNRGEVIQLHGDVISLGSGSTFSVSDERVSFAAPDMASEHAMLIWQPRQKTYMLSNRSPINPIAVNGSPCGHALLMPGMNIRIASVALEVKVEDYQGPEEQVATPATLSPKQNLYLGEVPNERSEVAPVWLQHGGAGAGGACREAPKHGNVVSESVANEPSAASYEASAADAVPSVAEEAVEEVQEEAPAEVEVAEPVLLGRLHVIKGACRDKSLDVYGDVAIGRSNECALTLTDSQVSRQHCAITFEDGEAYISSLSNTNTTKLGRTNVKEKTKLPAVADIWLASKVQLKWTAAAKA